MKEMVIEETTQEKILKVILFEIMRNNFLLGNSCEGYDKRKDVRNNLTAQMVKHKESHIYQQSRAMPFLPPIHHIIHLFQT